MDTQYIISGDNYRRLRPTLFMAIKEDGTQGDWIQVPGGSYRVDPDRAGVWITVEDLAAWKPFDVRNFDYSGGEQPETRSFATLLNLGILRMCLVGSVETDTPLEATSPRQSDAGSPYVREHVIRRGEQYYETSVYDDSIASPITLDPATVDDSDAAEDEAEQIRSAAQDILFHASIQVAADWPYQSIGLTVGEITGRGLSLGTGGSRAAQIVAARMDVASMKWELLTESAAKAMIGRSRGRKVARWQGAVPLAEGSGGSDMPDVGGMAVLGVTA